MKHLCKTVAQWLSQTFDDCFDDLAEQIEARDARQIVRAILHTFFFIAGLVVGAATLVILFVNIGDFLIGAALLFGCIYYFASGNSKELPPPVADDEIEAELLRQRAQEMQDEFDVFALAIIQAAAETTAILRPHELADIYISSAHLERFYLKNGVAFFQYEVALEKVADQTEIDVIQRELSVCAAKHVRRFPILFSDEARGRTPVEIFNIKSLGNRVLIELVQTNSASIAMIDARRRARIECQHRQRAVDADYFEY